MGSFRDEQERKKNMMEQIEAESSPGYTTTDYPTRKRVAMDAVEKMQARAIDPEKSFSRMEYSDVPGAPPVRVQYNRTKDYDPVKARKAREK